MAVKKEDEAYEKWAQEIKAKIPTEAQTHVDALLGTDAGKELFRGSLREADYYQRLNALHEDRNKFLEIAAEQNTWFEQVNKEYKEMAARVGNSVADPSDVTPPSSQGGGIDPAFLNELRDKLKAVEALDRSLPAVLGQMSTIAMRAAKEGFDVEPTQVIDFATKNRMDPLSAYNYLTADEREKRAAKEREKELASAREEGRKDALKNLQSPDRISHQSALTPQLDGLFSGKQIDLSDRKQREAAAMKEWFDMQNSPKG